MRGILIITEKQREMAPVASALIRAGHKAEICASDDDALLQTLEGIPPEIVIFDGLGTARPIVEIRKLLASECSLKEFLFIVIIGEERASEIDLSGIDDLIIAPFTPVHVVARLRLILWRRKNISGDQVVKVGALMIDLGNYEVTLDGMPIEMTFKEYELLKFLATHRGRVFTREALLNHVWGYDYYGGTRTVDVHIRRIRSKLVVESEHFIETVRNVGYRFAG